MRQPNIRSNSGSGFVLTLTPTPTPALPFCRILWPYYTGCLLLGSVLSVECRVPRNRILCKYPNQIHILKFNCFIRKFYLRGRARREQRRCLGRVLQTQPHSRTPPSPLPLPELPPIFNLFPLKKPSAERKDWKKEGHERRLRLCRCTGLRLRLRLNLVVIPPQHPGSSHPVRASGGAFAVLRLGFGLGL